MSLQDAASLAPEIGLPSMLSRLTDCPNCLQRLIVTSPNYMKDLSSIISHTGPEVLQGYFIWKAVQSFASYIDSPSVKPWKQFMNELQGKDPDSSPDRWRTCVSHIDDGLGWILSRFFIEKAFSAKAKEFGDLIVSDIKDEFVEKLKATEWMDDSVIQLAINKVHNIMQKIGYPTESPDVMDPDNLHKYYETVSINATTFFENELSMRMFDVDRMWKALGKPVDRAEWGMTAPTVNAC